MSCFIFNMLKSWYDNDKVLKKTNTVGAGIKGFRSAVCSPCLLTK